MIEQRIAQLDADVVGVKNTLDNLTESIKKIEEKTSFKESLMTKDEFAKLCRVSSATISRRLEKGLYDTPKNHTLRAYYNQGNQSNALFNVPIAMEYFEINKSFHTAP